ncbi:histidine phosphatase family protein [Candidatus Rhodobacter oscarellae]|uniref:histidine phosphatase family protein n=1 Tax=Candidatus Rhodobacter oscarellae TaxID=1675527 RepID=UPI00067139F9|nr:histidine phosphatase family protein [Candidatus Rhodobacter lobularis]
MRPVRLILGLLTLLAACAAPGQVSVPPETTLIILRHADRVGEDLTEQGIARAEALVAALEGVPIDAIYAPGIKRNLETAVPLARARGLTVQRIPAENPAAQLMASGAGKTIVWIGNKGNLQSIWDAISAPEPPPLNYGDLFFVTRARVGSPLVERRRVEP